MDVRADSQAARCRLMEALSNLGPAQDRIRCSIASHPTSVVHVVLRLRAGCWSTLCCHIICLGIAEVGGGALESFILAFLIVAALAAQSIPRWSEYSIGVALRRQISRIAGSNQGLLDAGELQRCRMARLVSSRDTG